MSVVYEASPIKRVRRTKDEMEFLRESLFEIVIDDAPMTVRQVFYQAVSRGLVKKTEAQYGAVQRALADMRRSGKIPYRCISDNTRFMRKPTTWSSLDAVLENAAASYRRAVWDNQDAYVEIWLEKDALSGVLSDVTRKWDVPLMVTRGYSSLSFLHSAAEMIASQDRPCYLYYFGDYDPSGLDIDRKIEETIRELAPAADFTVERVAVNESQIEEFHLPTRPTKKSDTRSKSFKGESVELDAIPPALLRELCSECILRHIDQRELQALRFAEQEEREQLRAWVDTFKG